jgi:hypothetical protein
LKTIQSESTKSFMRDLITTLHNLNSFCLLLDSPRCFKRCGERQLGTGIQKDVYFPHSVLISSDLTTLSVKFLHIPDGSRACIDHVHVLHCLKSTAGGAPPFPLWESAGCRLSMPSQWDVPRTRWCCTMLQCSDTE